MGIGTLKPVQKVRLADEVQDRIRQAIVSGAFRFGDALAEPRLAEQFGVSRAPVREALVALEREGLVESAGGGRMRVITIGRGDFAEICSLRSAYERLAGSLVAANWNRQIASDLDRNLEHQRRASTWSRLSSLDMDFHELIVQASGHRRLLASWRMLRSQCEVCLVHFFGLEKKLGLEPREVTVKAHEALIEALASGSSDRAAAALAGHAESWMSWLDQSEE